ncbi:MAG: anaerobic glycerol-3-phosphate dehydrogenase subunit A [Spirochaetes bacterium]|nr:MAG: anaerobic glycerol-3-phosphate dehydrogenase subunit A [Spirochaetota bacterium]
MNNIFDLIIIGGGSTGAGIARDMAMRGAKVLLLERNYLASGATGACQALVHSGCRYVTQDIETAKECFKENMIIRKIAKSCVEETGGLFVTVKGDDESYVDLFLEANEKAKIPVTLINKDEGLKIEPNLSNNIEKVVKVPDAAIDPFKLVIENIKAALELGAKIYTHTEVLDLIVEKGKVCGVVAFDKRQKEKKSLRARLVINASGAWGSKIAKMAGYDLPLSYSKGSILITNSRLTNVVVNRLRPPSDGDIIVPSETVTLLGTTSVTVKQLDNLQITYTEVETIINEIAKMVPAVRNARFLRAYTGVRPLFKEKKATDDRNISRGFRIFDHKNGMISIIGGKMITYRLMAEKVSDLACKILGIKQECKTHVLPLPSTLKGMKLKAKHRLSSLSDKNKSILCECELITKDEVEEVLSKTKTKDLNDIRIETRMGMGTCQGTFCAHHALGLMAKMDIVNEKNGNKSLIDFLERRWRGILPVIDGDQIKEEQLTEGIYAEIFNLDKERIE